MPNILGKIFGTGAKEVVESVGGVLDNLITSKEEKEAAKLAIEKEVNRHFEQLQQNLLKEKELDVQDRDSARKREAAFLTATGHADYLMTFLAIFGCIAFGFMVYMVMTGEIPENNRELIFHIFGIIEGAMIINIFQYFFGSSQGSRIKDMRK